MAHYGIGALTAVTILAELGDCRRFSSSRHAVRYAGMDITVHQSDQRRAPGHLSRQGPPALRWALFEAAQVARRTSSPDRDYYVQAAERLGGNRACLSVARKLLKRSYHTLRELGEEALRPHELPCARQALTVTDAPRPAPGSSCRHPRVDGPERPSGRNAYPHSGITPSTIMSPARHTRRVADRDKAGRPRAQHPHHQPRALTPSQPQHQLHQPRTPRLTLGPCTDKERCDVRRGRRIWKLLLGLSRAVIEDAFIEDEALVVKVRHEGQGARPLPALPAALPGL